MKPSLKYMFCCSLLPNWVINFYNQGFKDFAYRGEDFLENVFDRQLDKFLESYTEYCKGELAPTPISKVGKLFEFGFYPGENESAPTFITLTPYKKGTLEKILWIFLPAENNKEERLKTATPLMVGVAMYSDHARFFLLSEINVNKFAIHEIYYESGDPVPKFKDHGLTEIEAFQEKVFILACNDETRKFTT
ncbi:MAG: hypothetical protein FWB72_02970 [Firmicutes bacterium]|nr:hypothetical protein [Bacillota bacterium]